MLSHPNSHTFLAATSSPARRIVLLPKAKRLAAKKPWRRDRFSSISTAVATDSAPSPSVSRSSSSDEEGEKEKIVLPTNESSERLLRIRHTVMYWFSFELVHVSLIGDVLSLLKVCNYWFHSAGRVSFANRKWKTVEPGFGRGDKWKGIRCLHEFSLLRHCLILWRLKEWQANGDSCSTTQKNEF